MNLSVRRTAYVRKLDEAVQRIVEVLPGVEGIQRVSLFGSCARGRRDLFTDLDLLVIWETPLGTLDRLKFLYALLNVPVDLDIICYTPAEFQELKELPFLRRILSEQVILYEKKSA